jgi:hypothetical protein
VNELENSANRPSLFVGNINTLTGTAACPQLPNAARVLKELMTTEPSMI